MDINHVNKVLARLATNYGIDARTRIQKDIGWIYNNRDEIWHIRAIPGLSTKVFNTFREFITYRTPWGLGWTINTAEAMILPELPEIWQEVEAGIEPLNIHGVNQYYKQENEDVIYNVLTRGTSRDYKIAKLKRDAPEYADRVIKGELSATQAMIMIGKEQRKITHPATPEGFYKAAVRYLNDEDRNELLNLLTRI